MAESTAARLGGIGGILFVVLFFRSYLTPPDAPVPSSRPQDVVGYFADRQDGILLFNGLLLIFAAFFFLWFLGALHGVLRSAEGGGGGISTVALAGGARVHNAGACGGGGRDRLPCDPRALRELRARCPAGLPLLGALGMDVPLRLGGHVGLIAATSVVVLGTGVMPRWLALAGLVAALFALLRFLIPLGAFLDWCGCWRSRP